MSTLYNGTVSYDPISNVFTASTAIATADLQTLIQTAPDFSTIQFQAGHYVLTQGIIVTRGDITLQGAGQGQTFFDAQFAQPQSIFQFDGHFGVTTALQSDIQAGTSTITVQDASKFAVVPYYHGVEHRRDGRGDSQ